MKNYIFYNYNLMDAQQLNSAWMLEGAYCWVYLNDQYYRGHIQKVSQSRTLVTILLEDNRTCEVEVAKVQKASLMKCQDLTHLPHLNQPEIFYRIKSMTYLDKHILLEKAQTSLTDYIQYRKYIDERLILNSIPPHFFSALFFAYQNIDNQKNTQLFVTGSKGSGKSRIVTEVVQFLSKDFTPIYKLIYMMVTDLDFRTQAVINYRFVLKNKNVIGINIQLYHLCLDHIENLQIFHNPIPTDIPECLHQYLKQLNKLNYKEFIEQTIQIINNLLTSSVGISIIAVLDFPGDHTQIVEKVEQYYIQQTFKSVKQELLSDQLIDLSNSIKFEDNIDRVDESQLKLTALFLKENQSIFIRIIQSIEDIQAYRILDSVRFYKSSYPYKMTFNEFYQRYHHLDAFNKKIPLQKHLNRSQDMKALVSEIAKRLNLAKGMIFGSQYLYLKKEVNENLIKLLCQHNIKLSQFAKIIQRAYRVKRFKDALIRGLKKIKQQTQNMQHTQEKESVLLEGGELPTQTHKGQSKDAEINQSEFQIDIEISDIEAYMLLDETQQIEYKSKKLDYLKRKLKALLDGTFVEEEEIAYSLLRNDQIKQRSEIIQQKLVEAKIKELQQIQDEVSDQECFEMLGQDQKFQYLVNKKQNQGSVAFKLLNKQQQQQIRQSRKMKKQTELLEKYYSQLEPFLSDLESFKLLNDQQQISYKELKLKKGSNIAFSLLDEKQKSLRRANITKCNHRLVVQKQYQVDDCLSDVESFKLLDPAQVKFYKSQKRKHLELLRKQNKVRYGFEYVISDPESLKLLTDKSQWASMKSRLDKCQDYSDQEAFILLDESQLVEYQSLKSKGTLNAAISLIDLAKYDQFISKKILSQQRLDEIGIIKSTLLDSLSFRLLDDKGWEQRKKQLIDELQQKKERRQIGYYCDHLDSVAYDLLTIEQKQVRKSKEVLSIKLKEIINPVLFEDEIHPFSSIAYKLLKDKDAVKNTFSLSYMLLKEKELRSQQLRGISLYYWEVPDNLSQKQQLLQDKITKYEHDCIKYNKIEFSDYEAFKLLDDDQLLDYKENAYGLLDEQQKLTHRKLMKSKLIRSGNLSDLESYQLLSDGGKERYIKLKQEEISDYPAYEVLESKERYQELKKKKKQMLSEIKQNGFQVYFGEQPQIMSIQQFDELSKEIQYKKQLISNEEEALAKQLQSLMLTSKREKSEKSNIVTQLIAHPNSQPYLMSKFQNHKRILDIRSAPECSLYLQFSAENLEVLEQNKFSEFCNQRINTQGKSIEKIMKCQVDTIKHSLTKVQDENAAINMFRSILKFTHMKRSRYPTKVHLERILCLLIGADANIELPPPPNKLLKQNLIDLDQIKKFNEELIMQRKFSDHEVQKSNQDLREEVFCQIFKQIENNKKEHIFHLLRLAIVISHCVKIPKPLPFIQYLADKLEVSEHQCQAFKNPEIFKYTKQLIKNLTNNSEQLFLKDEEKIPTTPRIHLPSESEIALMFECKQVVVKLLLHSETPIWVAIDHQYSVANVVKAACSYIDKLDRQHHFGLQIIERKNNNIVNQLWLQDGVNFMDILNKYEWHEEIYKNNYKVNRTFEIYLSIREFYRLEKSDIDSLELFYHQISFELRRYKAQLKPNEHDVLIMLQAYIKSNGMSQDENLLTGFKFSSTAEAKLEFLKIFKMAVPNVLEDID